MALVERAAALRARCPRDQYLRTLTDPAQPFHDRDMYVFVLDSTGAYGPLPAIPRGWERGCRMCQVLRATSWYTTSWRRPNVAPAGVEYDFTNPVTGAVQTKMSFVQRVDDAYLGCGVYKTLVQRS